MRYSAVFIYDNGDVVLTEEHNTQFEAFNFIDQAFMSDFFTYKSASYEMDNVVQCFIHEVAIDQRR